jgi:hypothetical protein
MQKLCQLATKCVKPASIHEKAVENVKERNFWTESLKFDANTVYTF